MASYAILADVKEASWRSPNGRFSGKFNPSDKFGFAYEEGRTRMNPEGWNSTDPLYAARLFVGFNVGKKATWTMEDLLSHVKRVRREQVGKPDHSILYQKGVYTSKKTGEETTESGGQVIILNLDEYKTGKAAFREQIVDLADVIIDKMQQEEVIVEIQRDGVRVETIGVLSEKALAEARREEVAKIEVPYIGEKGYY